MRERKKAKRTAAYIAVSAGAALLLSGCGSEYQVLDPAGPVAQTELHLIVMSALLMLVVIIPVFILFFYIVYRYRDRPGNTAPYEPNHQDSRVLETIWWGIPILIVAILGAYTIKTTFILTKPPTNTTPITVEVTSMDWKWLFQYPGSHIATVNYLDIPVGVPVQFVLTSNAPMNSFWVPRLGGQEYTMPGMAMRLWLQASYPGAYYGHGANFTGRGFTHTTFYVYAKPMAQFNAWVQSVKKTAQPLTMAEYKQLGVPGIVGNLTFSSYPKNSFYNTVMNDGGKYMASTMDSMMTIGKKASSSNMAGMAGMGGSGK